MLFHSHVLFLGNDLCPGQTGYVIPLVCSGPVLGSLCSCMWLNTFRGRCLKGFLIRWLNYLNWLLLMRRNSGSSPSLFGASDLPTPSLKLPVHSTRTACLMVKQLWKIPVCFLTTSVTLWNQRSNIYMHPIQSMSLVPFMTLALYVTPGFGHITFPAKLAGKVKIFYLLSSSHAENDKLRRLTLLLFFTGGDVRYTVQTVCGNIGFKSWFCPRLECYHSR